MSLELKFKLTDKAKWKQGKFIIDNLTVSNNIAKSNNQSDEDISYDNIKLFLDDTLYDNSIITWAGSKLSADNIFEQCLNAYLRNDTDIYESFDDGWKIFNKLDSLKEYDGELLIKMPVYSYGQIKVWQLDLATPNHYFYSYYDEFLLLNSNGAVIIDMGNFYEEALIEDVCAILKDQLRCLYKSENVDYMIKEEGGPQQFLEQYDN